MQLYAHPRPREQQCKTLICTWRFATGFVTRHCMLSHDGHDWYQVCLYPNLSPGFVSCRGSEMYCGGTAVARTPLHQKIYVPSLLKISLNLATCCSCKYFFGHEKLTLKFAKRFRLTISSTFAWRICRC